MAQFKATMKRLSALNQRVAPRRQHMKSKTAPSLPFILIDLEMSYIFSLSIKYDIISRCYCIIHQILYKRFKRKEQQLSYNSENMFTILTMFIIPFFYFCWRIIFGLRFWHSYYSQTILTIMPVTSADVGSSCLRCLEALVFVDFHIVSVHLHANASTRKMFSARSTLFFLIYTRVYVQYGTNLNSLLPVKLFLQIERSGKLNQINISKRKK